MPQNEIKGISENCLKIKLEAYFKVTAMNLQAILKVPAKIIAAVLKVPLKGCLIELFSAFHRNKPITNG
jgi:hypothetical protein